MILEHFEYKFKDTTFIIILTTNASLFILYCIVKLLFYNCNFKLLIEMLFHLMQLDIQMS